MTEQRPPSHKDLGWVFKSIFLFFVMGTVLMIAGVSVVYWQFSRGLPKIISVEDYRPATVTQVLASGANGSVPIGEFFKERRYLVPIEKIPELVIRAFVAAEDDRFFEHPGINIFSIIRAGIANFKAGHVVQGGSTITQQVAKSLLLTPERSFDRKIKEVILANRIEKNLKKQQILYLYLNQIYLGHGAYGIQAASHIFFRKDVSELTVAEAALLAGMPQAPSKYSPLLNSKRAKERQLYVLKRMLENKFISQAQMSEAAAQPLKIYQDEDLNEKYAPYYVEFIRKYLIEKYGEKAVYEEGLTVSVPISPELALTANKSVRDGLLSVDKRTGFRGPVQHLKTTEDIEKFLGEQRFSLIEKKIHFRLFLPDGRVDPIEAMHFAGLSSDSQLLEPGELYEAVVTGFDSKRKVARLMIGGARAELALEKMKWAKSGSELQQPSQVLQKGDVVRVSLVAPAVPEKIPELSKLSDITSDKIPEKTLEKPPEDKIDIHEPVSVSLEQLPIIQGSLFSVDAHTGYVLAMVGGYDFNQSEFNRATQAVRQPGSAFKPIIYAAALEKGFTPASVIIDSPIVFKNAEGTGTWKPNNFEEKFYGDTTFRQALIKSRNIPTVKIVQAVQVPNVIQFAKRLGMNAQFSQDLSISLGSAATTLLEITRIYALFPRLGKKLTPIFLTKILDRDGRVLEEAKSDVWSGPPTIPEGNPAVDPNANPSLSSIALNTSKVVLPDYPLSDNPDQVLDPRVAYVMSHLMKEVVNYGTGHEAKSLGRPAAGKTGTTNDSNDAWFMGFTPQVVTGVWVGFDTQKSIGPSETGAKVALPIWLNYMREAVKKYPEEDFQVPPGVVFASIDPSTGKPTSPNSSTAIKEAFIEGTQPVTAAGRNSTDTNSDSDFFKEDKE